MGKIDTLNGASVNRREREAGERYYLRHLLDAYPAELPEPIHVAQADDPTAPPVPTLPAELGPVWAPFLAANPRWRDLVRAHGMHSAQLPRAADGGKTLAMQLVNLTLRSVAGESNDAAPTVRKLPTSLQVSKLKLICTQAFKLDPGARRDATRGCVRAQSSHDLSALGSQSARPVSARAWLREALAVSP